MEKDTKGYQREVSWYFPWCARQNSAQLIHFCVSTVEQNLFAWTEQVGTKTSHTRWNMDWNCVFKWDKLSVPQVWLTSDCRMVFHWKSWQKKIDVCFERNVGISQQFFCSAQAKTFGVLIFYNCHKLKLSKLQTNAEKSLAFISPRFFFRETKCFPHSFFCQKCNYLFKKMFQQTFFYSRWWVMLS